MHLSAVLRHMEVSVPRGRIADDAPVELSLRNKSLDFSEVQSEKSSK